MVRFLNNLPTEPSNDDRSAPLAVLLLPGAARVCNPAVVWRE
jgi:hypothetical protein